MKKVVIVGAGPCGVLLAHYLLRRGAEYKIDIYERRSDPQKVSLSNSRTIPYGLNQRGLMALQKIAGLETAVKATCVQNNGNIIHLKNGKQQVWLKKSPTFNTDRTSLVMTLLSELTAKSDNSQVQIHFDCKCTGVDFDAKTVVFSKGQAGEDFTVDYDILIGADGARSIVRNNLLNTEFFEFEQQYVNSCYKTVYLPNKTENTSQPLNPNTLHVWRLENGINFGIVPQLGDKFIGILFFPQNNQQIVNFANKEEVIAFFNQHIPEVSQLLSEAEAEAFLHRPIATQLKIRCNRYHHNDSVLIVGDAAHAVSSSLGQGCNNAFEDVLILDRLLDECNDNWAVALEQFTIVRKPDVYALWELDTNVFPRSKSLFTEFIFRESLARFLHKLFPQLFVPALRDLLASSTLPYADILKSYRGWISRVKNSNEKFLSKGN
jgi:kynurenine 3-monooxygenase